MSYADVKRSSLKFKVEDMVFLRVAPMKGFLRLGRKDKLSPRLIGPFKIVKWIGLVAYKLTLPPSLSSVHDVFHVSMLRKLYNEPYSHDKLRALQIDENLSYEEKPVRILACEVKALCTRDIAFIKVLWRNHQTEKPHGNEKMRYEKNISEVRPHGCASSPSGFMLACVGHT